MRWVIRALDEPKSDLVLDFCLSAPRPFARSAGVKTSKISLDNAARPFDDQDAILSKDDEGRDSTESSDRCICIDFTDRRFSIHLRSECQPFFNCKRARPRIFDRVWQKQNQIKINFPARQMSNEKDINRLRALSEVCLAQTEIISLQKKIMFSKDKKKKHMMKELAGRMRRSVVMLRYNDLYLV